MQTTIPAAPRGMRDFYPEEMALRKALFSAWSFAAEQSAFKEYDACVVESLDLLTRKAGEEIVDQIYSFKDKSDRWLALRPEMTPTLARMVAARYGSLTFPLKWFTIAQCFRYERTTRGRKREHYQWNLDILGEDSVTAETEVIATAIMAMDKLGIRRSAYKIKFNNRALLGEVLSASGIIKEAHQSAFMALDKRGKISDEEIAKLLFAQGVTPQDSKKILGILEMKTLADIENLLSGETPAIQRIKEFIRLCFVYGIQDSLVFDISVVRGLSYYTGIVFEAFDSENQLRAIFGGGRYDNLLRDIGGTPVTGVGLGFGDVVIVELMNILGLTTVSNKCNDIAIGYMSPDQQETAMTLARRFRTENLKVDLALHPEKPKNFFSRTGKGTISEAIYLGPDDIERGTVRIKNLASREEREIKI